MTLNGWQRIGIAATALWIAAIVAIACFERWGNPALVFSSNYVFRFIDFSPAPDQPLKKTDPETGRLHGPTEVITSLSPYPVLRAVFIPPLVGWLIAYVMLWTVRWIKKGFNDGETKFMALVKCPECNSEVSYKAPHCVKCGCPIAPSDNSLLSAVQEQTPDGTTKKQPEPVEVQSNFFSIIKRLITHKYTVRVLMVFVASWIVGCISTKTDPSKIYLILSYPLAISGIAMEGFGGLTTAFVVVGSFLYIYGKVRKTPPSFYSYLAWTTILSSILLFKP